MEKDEFRTGDFIALGAFFIACALPFLLRPDSPPFHLSRYNLLVQKRALIETMGFIYIVLCIAVFLQIKIWKRRLFNYIWQRYDTQPFDEFNRQIEEQYHKILRKRRFVIRILDIGGLFFWAVCLCF